MTERPLNPEHRRVSERATELIKRRIAAPLLRHLERWDTEAADALNDPAFDRMEITHVEAPVATEAELDIEALDIPQQQSH